MQKLGPVLALEPVETWAEDTAGWHTVRGVPLRLFAWLGELPEAMGRARRLMVSDPPTVAAVTEILRFEGPEGPTTVAAHMASGVYVAHLSGIPKRPPKPIVLAILRDLAEALAWVQGPDPVSYGASLAAMRIGFDGVTRLELSVHRPSPMGVIVNYFPDASDAFPEVDERGPADLWRLGVLAAELTHGDVFGGRQPRVVDQGLLDELGPVVRALLAPDPLARPTAAELAEVLAPDAAPPEAVASLIAELFPDETRAHIEHVEELRAQLPDVDDAPPVEIVAALA